MITRIEKQRDVSATSNSFVETNAQAVKFVDNSKGAGTSNNNENLQRKIEKMEKLCIHCHRNGHTKDICFKIHGYPEMIQGSEKQERHGTCAS